MAAKLEGEGALVAGPLKKDFFAISLRGQFENNARPKAALRQFSES